MADRSTRRSWAVGIAGVVLAATAPKALASFHEWRISEVFSNASGTVQFIEFQHPPTVDDDERFLQGVSFSETAFGNNFSFPSNLPSTPTANAHSLVATPGYAALGGGVPTADYILPGNNWFSPAGDTLNYFFGIYDNLTFTNAQLPKDGSNSLNRTSFGVNSFASLSASPTNFAGTTGTVPEPTALAPAAAVALAALRRRRVRLR
jgi:serralysin